MEKSTKSVDLTPANRAQAYKQAQRFAAIIQHKTQRLAKYFETSVPFLAEAGVNGTGAIPATPEGVIKPFADFMTSVETVIDATKAAVAATDTLPAVPTYTVAHGYNTINDYEAGKYVKEATAAGLAAKNRKGLLTAPTPKQLQSIAAKMHTDVLHTLFCPKAGMFAALLWYTEALLTVDRDGNPIVADVATWIAPFNTLITDVQAQLDKWVEDKVKGKVSDKNIETITPYTFDMMTKIVKGIEGHATLIVELITPFLPTVDPVDPPAGGTVPTQPAEKTVEKQAPVNGKPVELNVKPVENKPKNPLNNQVNNLKQG